MLQQQKPLVAASLYEQALEMFPAGPLATVCQFGCGRACELSGQATDARKMYQQLVKNQEHCGKANLHLGLLSYNEGDFPAAEAQFGSAIQAGLATESNASTSAAVLREAHYWRGMSRFAQQEFATAEEDYRQFLADSVGDPLANATVVRYLAESLMALGRAAAAAEEIEAFLQNCSESDASIDECRMTLALALAQLGKWDRADEVAAAVEHIEKNAAARQRNGRSRWLVRIADTASKQGEVARAKAWYQDVVELGNCEPAVLAAQQRLVALERDESHRQQTSAVKQDGVAAGAFAELLENGDLDSAEKWLLAHPAETGCHELWYRLAEKFELVTDAAAASRCLQKIHAEFRHSQLWGEATLRLARDLSQRQHDLDGADQLLEQLLETVPAVPAEIEALARYERGQMAAALGQWEKASLWMGQISVDHVPRQLALRILVLDGRVAFSYGRLGRGSPSICGTAGAR